MNEFIYCILFWAVLCEGMGCAPHLAVLGVTCGWYVADIGSTPACRAALFMTISKTLNGQHTCQHRCATTATHRGSGSLNRQTNGQFSVLFVGRLTQTAFIWPGMGWVHWARFIFIHRVSAWDVHAYCFFAHATCHAQNTKIQLAWFDRVFPQCILKVVNRKSICVFLGRTWTP